MKKHLLAFAVTAVALATAGNALLAQNDGIDPAVLAKLAARRAAEEAGGTATPTPDAAAPDASATATPAADAATPAAPATATVATADTISTNAGDTTAADEARRKAAMQAAITQVQSNADIPGDFAYLQIIPHRNIFDPSRQPWSPTRRIVAPPVVRVERFICTGTARKIGKGYLAMFSGDGVPDYPTELSIGATINGFKIKDITDATVVLTDISGASAALAPTNVAPAGTNLATAPTTNVPPVTADVVLTPTQGLTRSDGGPWKQAYAEPVYAVVTRGRQLNDVTTAPTFQVPQYQPNLIIQDNSTDPSDPNAGAFSSRTQRGTRGPRAGGNRRGGGGGFGGAGGGFGGGTTFAPGGTTFNITPADTTPAAPPDPAVLARLQARRAAEGQ